MEELKLELFHRPQVGKPAPVLDGIRECRGRHVQLRPKLWRELKPGTRVLSYVHSMGDWPPQEVRNVESDRGRRKLFLWIIAANAGDRARGIRQPGFLFTAH
jgi:hypothetical protein